MSGTEIAEGIHGDDDDNDADSSKIWRAIAEVMRATCTTCEDDLPEFASASMQNIN